MQVEGNILIARRILVRNSWTFERQLAKYTCLHANPSKTAGAERGGEIDLPDLMELRFLRADESDSRQAFRPSGLGWVALWQGLNPEVRTVAMVPISPTDRISGNFPKAGVERSCTACHGVESVFVPIKPVVRNPRVLLEKSQVSVCF